MRVEVMAFGAGIKALWVPDRRGQLTNVVLGHVDDANYVTDKNYIAGVIGRYANRIARSRFLLDGTEVRLAPNDGPHQLHGGDPGFHKVEWTVTAVNSHSVDFAYRSPAGEGGFPGNLNVWVRYTLIEQGLAVIYRATTDAPTVINLTNHPYFNLAGQGLILDHELTIYASRFTPVDESLIPTGELGAVEGTRFDFRTPRRIAEEFDHNFVLDRMLRPAAVLREHSSGRQLKLFTIEPGLQLYTGNNLPGNPHPVYGGVCLEPQHFPDSPNHPEFPSTILRPGAEYRSTSWYVFSQFT
jgi:aldose 1-epimerase